MNESPVSITQLFLVFLQIGATSFGGGVVAYLRNALVRQKKWLDDAAFLELMSLSNSLPGLNATNMAILVGDRLRGVPGATVAMLGMCVPGFIFMTIAGYTYGLNGDRPLVTHMLHGVAAAATGLIASTWFQIGKKSVNGYREVFFILLAILGVNQLKLSVPVVLVLVTALALYAYRPARPVQTAAKEEDEWINSLQ